MSWYKRKPRRHEPVSYTPPKNSSPATERLLEQTEQKIKSLTSKSKNK